MTPDDLKQWRVRLGLSRAEAARRLPVPYRTWENWEAGTYEPPDYLYRALSDLELEIVACR